MELGHLTAVCYVAFLLEEGPAGGGGEVVWEIRLCYHSRHFQ
jgi:hypothetical protein